MKTRRVRLTNETIHISQVANGFIVTLPEEDYPEHYGDYQSPQQDFMQKIIDPKFWFTIIEMFRKAKAGEPIEEPEANPMPTPVASDIPMNGIRPTESHAYIFNTWKEASTFIQDYYKN